MLITLRRICFCRLAGRKNTHTVQGAELRWLIYSLQSWITGFCILYRIVLCPPECISYLICADHLLRLHELPLSVYSLCSSHFLPWLHLHVKRAVDLWLIKHWCTYCISISNGCVPFRWAIINDFSCTCAFPAIGQVISAVRTLSISICYLLKVITAFGVSVQELN